jgi:N-acetylmuramoyl-L-alanine amidase-like protein
MALLDFTGSPHGGRQRHLPEWQSQPRITPTTIIDHSIVGSAEGAWQMFHDRSVLESHFIVGLTGEIWQLMDTGRQADANLDANDFAISIETADLGDPDNQPWTTAQLASLIWLHERLLAAHPSIPRRKCPTWNGGGLGFHTLFGAPSHWTPVAKSCPGRVRKAQWNDVLLPAFLRSKEADDMPLDQTDKQWFVDTLRTGFAGDKTRPVRDWAVQLEQAKATLDAGVIVNLAPDQLTQLAEQLAPLVREGLADQVADKLAKRLAE